MKMMRLAMAILFGVALISVLANPPGHGEPQAAPLQQRDKLSPCTGAITSTISTNSVRTCDVVTASVGIEPQCPSACPGGVNVVFVHYVARDWQWRRQVSEQALNVLIAEDDRREIDIKVGVIHYDKLKATQVLRLTDDLGQAMSRLRGPNSGSIWGGYKQAATEALKMLREARRESQNPLAPCEIVLFYAFAKDHPGGDDWRAELLEAARSMHSEGIKLMVACPADVIECESVREMPLSPENYTEPPEIGKAAQMFRRELTYFRGAETLSLQELALTQRLPEGLDYVDGSASTPPESVARSGGETLLKWRWTQFRTTDAFTTTYQMRPLKVGAWPIQGQADLVDRANWTRLLPMTPLTVTVAGLCLPDPSPTPTDAPTPTPTDTPTAEPTPTATPIPTATSTETPAPTAMLTPTPGALYLPLLLREACAPETRLVDVVLVIDASSSMTERTPAGRTKIDAAIAAARAFLDALRFDRGDQAAIVAFNAGATLLAPLTGDRAALEAALAAIRTAPQTCIVCAVETAAAELGSPRHVPAHTATMILLTDGRSNPRPVGEAVERAAAAKARGVVVFTIGLGADLDDAALAAMASRPAHFYRAPEADGLADIYAQIAVEIPCPAEAFWGGR